MPVRNWNAYVKNLLLEGRWLPVTESVAFFQADPQTCVDVMLEHTQHNAVKRFGSPRRVKPVEGAELTDLLAHLLPLQAEEHRKLFLPTANPEWTAMFTNAHLGTDLGAHAAMGWWGVRALMVTDSPNNYDRRTRQGFSGIRNFSLVEKCDPWTPRARERDHIAHVVGVRVLEGGWAEKLGFSGADGVVREGVEFPVGKVWDETARSKQDRFTHEHLALACERMGLRPFDEDFYAPDGWGLMIERTDVDANKERSWTLAQARHEEP